MLAGSCQLLEGGGGGIGLDGLYLTPSESEQWFQLMNPAHAREPEPMVYCSAPKLELYCRRKKRE